MWTLVSLNKSVNKDLLACKNDYVSEFEEMKNHLQSTPSKGIPGTLKQMVSKNHVWEYSLKYGVRVIYTLNVKERQVIIGYAGKHFGNTARTDEVIRQLDKLC